MQTVLMAWLMDIKRHEWAIPNVTVIFPWEADLISMTRAGLTHEYEIKVSVDDFRRDKLKEEKHTSIKCLTTGPNYFWYATPDIIDIRVPDYAGWLVVKKSKFWYEVRVQKKAPMLHVLKLPGEKKESAARLLAYRLASEMRSKLVVDTGKD